MSLSRTLLMAAPALLVAAFALWSPELHTGDKGVSPPLPPEHALTEVGSSAVVVELFTSEGCSSCPPADALLSTILTDARRSGTRVFPLAFHVDYWNRLGWSDPYSSAAFSERQGAYAAALHLDNVYTPQMIVNGTHEFVGSDREEATKSIEQALRVPLPVTVTLRPQKPTDGGRVLLEYALTGNTAGDLLNIAVVERDLQTDVKRGENEGRKLHHDNVVRLFQTFHPGQNGSGRETIQLPASMNRANASIIAYVQNGTTMKILGATGMDLPG